MVYQRGRKIVSMLYKEVGGLHQAAYLLGVFAILSQILALLRDRLFAHTFGAGPLLDTYYASFRLPDLMFAAVSSLVSVYVLIPLLEARLHNSADEARKFLSDVWSFFFFFITGVSLFLFIVVPILVPKIFPGFSSEQLHQLVILTRIMLLQPILLGSSNLFASIAQIKQRFLLYAVTPLLYNLGIIIGILLLYPAFGYIGLAWGVVLGALLHLGVQVPYIITSGLLPKIKLHIDWSAIRGVVMISLPRTITLSSQQIGMLALTALASLFAAGSISVFSLAYNLQSVPLSVIGVSYSVAAFPTLAKLYASGEREKFLRHIVAAAKHILFWSFPATALFIVLRAHIVRVILGSGSFNWDATRLTAAALALFTISLVAQSLVLLLVRGYYAAGNTIKPLVVNVFSTAFSIVCAYLFIILFVNVPGWRDFWESMLRVADLPGTTVLMLPLGFACGSIFNALMLLLLFEGDVARVAAALWPVFWKSSLASLAAGGMTYLTLTFIEPFFPLTKVINVFASGFIAGMTGLLFLILILKLLRSEEFETVLAALHSRLRTKSRVVVPETQ